MQLTQSSQITGDETLAPTPNTTPTMSNLHLPTGMQHTNPQHRTQVKQTLFTQPIKMEEIYSSRKVAKMPKPVTIHTPAHTKF